MESFQFQYWNQHLLFFKNDELEVTLYEIETFRILKKIPLSVKGKIKFIKKVVCLLHGM